MDMWQVNKSLRKKNILVVGDIMLDKYWSGDTNRISPEAPVPVVKIEKIEDKLGGAGNVAINSKSLGNDVSIIGFVGKDAEGNNIKKILCDQKIDDNIISIDGHETILKLRIMSKKQQIIRVDFEKKFENYAEEIVEKFEKEIVKSDIVILSDYNKGTLEKIPALIKICKKFNKKVIVDPKGSEYEKYKGASFLTPNYSEFESFVGICRDEDEIYKKGLNLIERLNLEGLLITRSENGITLISKNKKIDIPTVAKDVYDVTGAGDTVISVFASMIANNIGPILSAQIANHAAGIVVGKVGASNVTIEELIDVVHSNESKVISKIELKNFLRFVKAKKNKIVMTNGCFDILHPGHIDYLKKAKAMGDILIVALNSDDSVKKLKGDTRPVNSEIERSKMLECFDFVDKIVIFDELTPKDLYADVLPDVLVKGGDYNEKNVVGADSVIKNGGQVKIVEYLEGYSSSNIIEKIKRL